MIQGGHGRWGVRQMVRAFMRPGFPMPLDLMEQYVVGGRRKVRC